MPTVLRGHVTKSTQGTRPWAALHGNGKNLGNHVSLRDAQLEVEKAYGGRVLSWTRNDINGVVENWEAVEQQSPS